ncbi:MAG: alpha/beta fold hydrolase [Streptosporangiaceae bacterium]
MFVHGAGTSSYLWRHVLDQLDGERRCIVIDLPPHGHTPSAANQDFSLPGLAWVWPASSATAPAHWSWPMSTSS